MPYPLWLPFQEFLFDIADHGFDAGVRGGVFEQFLDVSQRHGCAAAGRLRINQCFCSFGFESVRIEFFGHDATPNTNETVGFCLFNCYGIE